MEKIYQNVLYIKKEKRKTKTDKQTKKSQINTVWFKAVSHWVPIAWSWCPAEQLAAAASQRRGDLPPKADRQGSAVEEAAQWCLAVKVVSSAVQEFMSFLPCAL